MSQKIEAKKILFLLELIFILCVNIVVFLEIPYLKQIYSYFFLTLLPGLLILRILKFNELNFTEKFVLAVSLSISFLMFFGLLINEFFYSIGYKTPLAVKPLIITFSFLFIVMESINYKRNNYVNINFISDYCNLSALEKTILIIALFFPVLSIYGTYLMNITDNNIFLIIMLYSITFFILAISFINQRISDKLYPIIIFLMSISLLLMSSLRSNYLIGDDVHSEYYLFRITFENFYWEPATKSALNSCLSISLLPTIYQSFLGINMEYIFKVVLPAIFSIAPLIIYLMSKKYFEPFYAFLTSLFFMSQQLFIFTPLFIRSNIATLFLLLFIYTSFMDKGKESTKKLLRLIFIFSCLVSHYSTTYLFLILLFLTWLGMQIISNIIIINEGHRHQVKDTFASTSIIALFFTSIFVWYSQITESAFNSGIRFIQNIFSSLAEAFILESRGGTVMDALGTEVSSAAVYIKLISNWLVIFLLLLGILIVLIKYKQMISFANIKTFQKNTKGFLKSKIDIEYFVISIVGLSFIILSVIVPYFATGYGLNRIYFTLMTFLSLFPIIGGVLISKKIRCKSFVVPLIVIVIFFMSNSGLIDQMFNNPISINLNSKGPVYDYFYIHDYDVYAATWLQKNGDIHNITTYTDDEADRWLLSQAGITNTDDYTLFDNETKIDGYIYLKYYNVMSGKLIGPKGEIKNIIDYQDKFIRKNKIYVSEGSQVYR